MHEVVEAVSYRTPEGRSFSPYSSYIPANAERVVSGWTIRWSDGTEGTGRVAFKSREEAEAHLAKVNARNPRFKGMSEIGR